MIIQISKGISICKPDYEEPFWWMDFSDTVAVLLYKLYKYLLGGGCDMVVDDALSSIK